MDFTRFFLYSTLAVITYLMLLAWQEDYPPLVDNGQEFIAEQDEGSTSDIPVAQIPQAASSASTDSDLPQTQSTPQTTTLPTTPVNSGNTIEVNTDTLSLRIDLTGDPFVILNSNAGRSYVAQSGLIGTDGVDNPDRAQYRSTQDNYTLAQNADSLSVDLQTVTDSGVTITKRYTFNRDSYLIDISYLVDNQSSESWQANIFGQIKRDPFDDPSDAGGFGRTYLGFVTTSNDDPYIKAEFEDVDDGIESHDMEGGWIGFSQHYFISAWIPGDETVNRFSMRRNNANQYFGGFTSSAFTVPAGETGSQSIQYYAGPKDQYALAEIAPSLELTIDYGFLWFLAAPMYWILRQIESFVPNWGFSIILLTVFVKAAFYKLSETQYRSMANMRRLMPKMQQLKENYGDDKMKLQKATMEMYKKEKINPFGGCLPMLVQMPVFISLYWVLMESVELRHSPFIFYITDLSVRDPYFILPLLMGATMYLQTTLSPAPADPMQAKVMKFMPIGMTVLFLWFPAGLVLYWITNGALGIAQQWYITRKIENEAEARKG